MKKRTLEPPKLPWSKNKVASSPHLPVINPELPGSKSLLSLDSSVPSEMTTSSLSDSPKVLKAKISPLKGKEEALTQMVSKWRAKTSVKQQPKQPMKPTPTPPGTTKIITVTTTSSRSPSTLNSVNSSPMKGSVVFLGNSSKTRLVSKIKESPTSKTSKTDSNQMDSLSCIPVTSGPINSKARQSITAVNIKRKTISSQPVPPSNTPKCKTDCENISSKSVVTVLPQAKSSSLSSLVRLGISNSANSIPVINSSQTKAKQQANDKNSSQIKPETLKSSNSQGKIGDQSKCFYERRPKSGTVPRNVHKPLIIYLNEPGNEAAKNQNNSSNCSIQNVLSNIPEICVKNDEGICSILGSGSRVSDESIISANGDFDESIHVTSNLSSKESTLPSDITTSPMISEEPSDFILDSRLKETDILNSFDDATTQEPSKEPSNETSGESTIVLSNQSTPIIVPRPQVIEDLKDPPTTKQPSNRHDNNNELRPSFPICSSPSPSFTSSDNSYSDNDWDDCENYKKDSNDTKIFDFWFESTIDDDDDDDDVNVKTHRTSPGDDDDGGGGGGGLRKNEVDQEKLIQVLRKCKIQTSEDDNKSASDVTSKFDKDNRNANRMKLGQAYDNESIDSQMFNHYSVQSMMPYNDQYFDSNYKSTFHSKILTSLPGKRGSYLNEGEYSKLSDFNHRLNASSEDVRNILEWLKLENSELESRCKQLSRENSSLTELLKLSRRDLEISDLRNQQNKNETDIELDRLRSEKERLLNELQLPEMDRLHFVAMETEIDGYKRRIVQLESQHSEATNEAKDLKRELEEAKLEADEMRDRFSQEDNRDLRRLRDDLDCCLRECRLLHFKNRQSEKKCDLYRTRISDLEASLGVYTSASSKSATDDYDITDAENQSKVEPSSNSNSNDLLEDRRQEQLKEECMDRLKEELKEAREVSIRLHEECERLTKDCFRYSQTISELRRKENNFLSIDDDFTPITDKEDIVSATSPIKNSFKNNEDKTNGDSKNRIDELEKENKRLMEVLVYLRRKLELNGDEGQTLDTFKSGKDKMMDLSIQTKCFQQPADFNPSFQENKIDEDDLEGNNGDERGKTSSAPSSPPQTRPLLSPAIEHKESNKPHDVVASITREKADHHKETSSELISSVMTRHRQEMNSLLQTLRRKERQFSEERKILRRKNLELSEMFDLLAERAVMSRKTCSNFDRDSQTEFNWFEVEERSCRLEAEIVERITAEQLTRGRHADVERQLNERIGEYELKLCSLQESMNRKSKTIERKEQMIARLNSSSTEMEKSLTEKCRELEEKDEKFRRTSTTLLENEREIMRQGEENERLKRRIDELENHLTLFIDGNDPTQQSRGPDVHTSPEVGHLRETQNLNTQELMTKVNESFPGVMLRPRLKTNHTPSSRRSRSLSEMEHVIKTFMIDMNCTYSLVPLKPITKNQQHQSPTTNSNDGDINKSNIKIINPSICLRPKTADFKELNFVKNANMDAKLNKNERPNQLDLRPFDFSYPATPPSMIITPISTLPNSRDSLPHVTTNISEPSVTIASMNSEHPFSPIQDLMSSSLYEGSTPSPSIPEHSFTLPRSVKFTEQRFSEENALERLARSFDRKAENKHDVESKQRKDNLENKYRSISLSPRTARKRFLFHPLDNITTDNPSTAMGRRLVERNSPQPSKASSQSSQFSSESYNDNVQGNHQKAHRVVKTKETTGHKKARRDKDKSKQTTLSILHTTSDESSTSNELNSTNQNQPSRWLSIFVDPFKRLKKSSSTKSSQASSPQLLADKQTERPSSRSLTPPTRFFRETKPKRRTSKKQDSGSLPSLVQLSCLPSN